MPTRPPKVVLKMVAHATAGTHARTGHDDGAGMDHIKRRGRGALARTVQSDKLERIMSLANELRDFRLQALEMALHDFGGGDRHG